MERYTLLAAGRRTAGVRSADFSFPNATSMVVSVDVKEMPEGGSLALSLLGLDPVENRWFTAQMMPLVARVGEQLHRFFELPPKWCVLVTPSDASEWVYEVTCVVEMS